MPRRSSQPIPHRLTLAMNGMRQPHADACSAPSHALTSHADADPRMNPSVVPAAVELLIRPRHAGEASSVVYTIDPVNSPPSEKPWTTRRVTSRSGAATPIWS